MLTCYPLPSVTSAKWYCIFSFLPPFTPPKLSTSRLQLTLKNIMAKPGCHAIRVLNDDISYKLAQNRLMRLLFPMIRRVLALLYTTQDMPMNICDPSPANEALCSKINFEL